MSGMEFRIDESKNSSLNLRKLRLKIFKLRLQLFYLNFLRFLHFFKFLPTHIICHWIAFRYWIYTGEIMPEYLELLESQRSDSHF